MAAIQVTRVVNVLRQLSPAICGGREKLPVYPQYKVKNRTGETQTVEAQTVEAVFECNIQQLMVSYLAVLLCRGCL